MFDKVSLIGLVFYGYHGVSSEEKKLGQRFVVDVDLFGDFSEGAKEDNLEKCVHYVEVFESVKAIVEKKSFNLLEALALNLCESILSRFPLVKQVTVRVKKPQVPISIALEAAAVEFTRQR